MSDDIKNLVSRLDRLIALQEKEKGVTKGSAPTRVGDERPDRASLQKELDAIDDLYDDL